MPGMGVQPLELNYLIRKSKQEEPAAQAQAMAAPAPAPDMLSLVPSSWSHEQHHREERHVHVGEE